MTSNKLRATALEVAHACERVGKGIPLDTLYILAEIALADHPADDDEPVTEEWLRSVGLEYGARTKWNNGWSPGKPDMFGPTFRTPVTQSPRYSPEQEVWLYLSLDDAVSAWLGTRQSTILLPEQPTRGHVRQLCSAFGIPLKESP